MLFHYSRVGYRQCRKSVHETVSDAIRSSRLSSGYRLRSEFADFLNKQTEECLGVESGARPTVEADGIPGAANVIRRKLKLSFD